MLKSGHVSIDKIQIMGIRDSKPLLDPNNPDQSSE